MKELEMVRRERKRGRGRMKRRMGEGRERKLVRKRESVRVID